MVGLFCRFYEIDKKLYITFNFNIHFLIGSDIIVPRIRYIVISGVFIIRTKKLYFESLGLIEFISFTSDSNWYISIYCYLFWSILIYSHIFLYILMYSDLFWYIPISWNIFWYIVIYYNIFSCILIYSNIFRFILIHSDIQRYIIYNNNNGLYFKR